MRNHSVKHNIKNPNIKTYNTKKTNTPTPNIKTPKSKQTSWENVGGWYSGIVGDEGHYFHQRIILPGVSKLLKFEQQDEFSLLDLACGQGVLGRQLPAQGIYTGIDISSTLIKTAKSLDKNRSHEFFVGDASKPLPLKKVDYTHAAIILALQNIEHGDKVILNASRHLLKGGKFVIVLNHPCFRVPRQSSWGIDEEKKLQYRRIDRYQNEMKIPIQAHPSQGENSASTWSFHHPLAVYSKWLSAAGFYIEVIEEWTSDKSSTGKNAKMENRSREEIPLFMAILAVKK